jgi:predicted nucleic acid-binding protein
MIAYVDSSVLLRVALAQSNALPEWRHIDRGVSSTLISTESLRTLDRVRIRAGLSDIEVARRRATVLSLIDSLELIDVDSTVLDRAAQPMPTELGTLDAIHLASALLWKDAMSIDPVMATHDAALGIAAQAHGLKVFGT